VNAQVPVAANNTVVEVWCEANGVSTLFDDFRVHPVDAAMTSYVYNNWGELTHILDNNNLYTEYRYDGMGRLKETYKETFQTAYGNQGVVKVSEFAMNYGVNSPNTISLQITKTGGSGAVSPLGSVNVSFNTDQTVRLLETCTSGVQLRKVSIDGVEIPLGQPSYTLKDGSVAVVSNTAVTFKKMKSNHTLAVEYNQYSSDAGYRCQRINVGNGNTCPTGAIEFGTRDQCGVITWTVGQWVGTNKPDCCVGAPPSCGCTNQQQ
jgi:YD repeat-containing protein